MTLDDLRSAVSGPVLEPGESGYDDEVAAFNLAVTIRPDIVVGATDEADVVAAVRYAAEHRLPVHIQATGHGAHLPIDGGLLIATKRMDAVSIDPQTRRATIGAGARWAPVVAAAAPLGLAPITGSSPSVGVVGYLLGGGLGPFARSHGFSSDYVRGLRLVTPAGDAIAVSATEHPELFWALRGGKGGFGVVTEVTIELVPMPELYAGSLAFEGDAIEPAYRAWADYTASADDAVTTSVSLVHFPPLDVVPEIFRGKDILMVRFAYPGDAARGAELAAALRAAAPVYVDQVGPMPLADVGLIHNDPAEPVPSWSRGTLLKGIDQDFVTAVLKNTGHGAPFIACEVRHLGSRTAVDADPVSAVGGREGKYAFFVIGVPDPSLFAVVLPGAAEGVFAAIAPWIADETTINWAGGPESPDFAKAWPAATATRLVALREAGDPHGIFAYRPVP